MTIKHFFFKRFIFIADSVRTGGLYIYINCIQIMFVRESICNLRFHHNRKAAALCKEETLHVRLFVAYNCKFPKNATAIQVNFKGFQIKDFTSVLTYIGL